MSACAPKGRGQHFYSFQVEVELRSERGRRIDLDESHPRLDFPSHLLPPHSAAERITNFVTAQLEWLQGEEGGKGEGLCHHSHLGEVSSVTALGNQGLEAGKRPRAATWQQDIVRLLQVPWHICSFVGMLGCRAPLWRGTVHGSPKLYF